MQESGYKDLFSVKAEDYARFRPRYPKQLFEYLSSICNERNTAWDVATGNGQVAFDLADHFYRVIATDPSEKQLFYAQAKKNVIYQRATAESSGLADKSVDLITVGQAFHWFHQEQFFKEANRVLKDSGVLAIWFYQLSKCEKAVDDIVYYLYEDILKLYWEDNRKMIDNAYANVQFPFEKIASPHFDITVDWDLHQLVGYLSTWSAIQAYIAKNKKNPLEEIYPRLLSVWKDPNLKKTFTWPLHLIVLK